MSEDESIQVEAEPSQAEIWQYLEERSQNIARYSDKLRSEFKKLEETIDNIAKVSGIDFTDPETVFVEEGEQESYKYKLAIISWSSGIGVGVRKDGEYWGESSHELIAPEDLSRPMLVRVIKRLPGFLQAYAEALKEKELKYQNISAIAEKMAGCI